MKTAKSIVRKVSAALLSAAVVSTLTVSTASAYMNTNPSSFERFTTSIPTSSIDVSVRAPQKVKVSTLSRYSAKISWTAPQPISGKQSDIKYYVYRVYNDNYGVRTAFRISPELKGVTSYTLTGIEAKEKQQYFVRASHPGTTAAAKKGYNTRLFGFDTQVHANVLKPTANSADKKVPTMPGTLSYQLLNKNTIKLTWKASKDDKGMLGYRVFRMRDYNAAQIGEVKTTATSGLISYTIEGIELSPRHAFYVVAVDKTGKTAGGGLAVSYVSNQ